VHVTTIGSLIAAGRTSDVYAYGVDSVVKVPRPEVPTHWAEMEARFTAAVRQLGAPAPDVRELVDVDGRQAIVFERVDGESMWQRMLAAPDDVPALCRELGSIHRQILSTGLPPGVMGLVDRMCNKIDEAAQLSPEHREEARSIVLDLPCGAALLHGDLHPGNVLMRRGAPVVIDWFDATIGHPVADVVRSSLLMRPHGGSAGVPHLPGAGAHLLGLLHQAYAAEMADVLAVPNDVLRRWESVEAVSRLAEGAETDESWLVTLWTDRHAEHASPLTAPRSTTVPAHQ
jgi:hypothetical protein